jgi:hypothetical protein
MLTDEPRLQFVHANDFAHDDVVGAIVAMLRGLACQWTRLTKNEL